MIISAYRSRARARIRRAHVVAMRHHHAVALRRRYAVLIDGARMPRTCRWTTSVSPGEVARQQAPDTLERAGVDGRWPYDTVITVQALLVQVGAGWLRGPTHWGQATRLFVRDSRASCVRIVDTQLVPVGSGMPDYRFADMRLAASRQLF